MKISSKKAWAFKAILILAMPLPALSAGPTYLGESPDISVYAYTEAIKVVGPELVEGWTLYDFKSRQFINGVSLLSVKSLNIFNCRERRVGILNDIYYSDGGGKGRVVWNGAVERSAVQWQYVAPKSLTELKFDFVCEMARNRK